jgi:lipid II:glycine glycyltransferase (peptidoglycan interpeptide bridge formation enzyme)
MICALIKKELAGKMGEPAAIVALKERLKNLEITLAKIRRERGDWEAQASEMRNQAAEMREQAAAMREHAAEFRAIAATVRVQAESIRVNPVPQKTHEFRDSTDEIIEQSLAERRKQNKTITPKKDA